MKTLLAYHFTAEPLTLRDGTKCRLNRWTRYEGDLSLCRSGLHASIDPFDSLKFAPGPFLYRVKCGGKLIESDDKLVCSQRMALAGGDATIMLRYFARLCALDVIHLWDAPAIVRGYLETGDDTKRDAAGAAAWDARAARAAAGDAAWAAAWDAAGDAARAARAARAAWAAGDAWAAAGDGARAAWAAGDAARAARAAWAAGDAARAAAWAAARDAARAAWAAGDAARDAARAAWAAGDAAWAAAGDAARDAQRKRFARMTDQFFAEAIKARAKGEK